MEMFERMNKAISGAHEEEGVETNRIFSGDKRREPAVAHVCIQRVGGGSAEIIGDFSELEDKEWIW